MSTGLPYRGRFGDPRPGALAGLPLPPAPMPARRGLRPLKAWRYVGVFGPELMLCVAVVRIGPARQCFWAVWDRSAGRLYERTRLGRGGVRLTRGNVRVEDGPVQIELALVEGDGIETVCPSGHAYAWTRKQAVAARGMVIIGGRRRALAARAVIDDTAAYYERHTAWHWTAGVGRTETGQAVAWNLVSGVNDPPRSSERTVWIGEEQPVEVPPATFAADLSGVDGLRFSAEATRERSENRLLIRSRYRQPFGTFSGTVLPGLVLAEGYGVMEEHDVHW